LVSQAEARVPLVPTLPTPLGGKGPRPVGGTWDNKDLVSSFAAMTGVPGPLTTRFVESAAPANRRTGLSKTARWQPAWAAPLRDLARASPATLGKPVFVTIANAPWQRGGGSAEVLAAPPPLPRYRLPSYSPQLHVIERWWRVWRRRATHNRLFASMPELRTALRASFCYFQTLRHKILFLIHCPRKKKEAKLTDA
jgi:transposase